jgi:hypothetical protein
MATERLRELAENFEAFPADDFEDLARECWDLSVTRLDVRYMVVRECLVMSQAFFGEGDPASVSAEFYSPLKAAWESYLSAILDEDEATGTQLALTLHEELRILGLSEPTQ